MTMGIVEPIAIGLGLHLGKKVVDWLWNGVQNDQVPVASPSGNLGFAAPYGGRTQIGQEFTVPHHQVSELVVGTFYIPDSLEGVLRGDEVTLVLIVEQATQQVLFFAADLEAGYEVHLPHGIYSFFVFLMDSTANDFWDAEIYATGFPCTENLSGFGTIFTDDPDDIWNIVDDCPLAILSGGPYALDFILIDNESVPELPMFFSEILDNGFDTGYGLTCPVCDLSFNRDSDLQQHIANWHT